MTEFNNKDEINRMYTALSPRADLEYTFVTGYADYIHGVRDYGTGLLINMVEVHTLTMIADSPGITGRELCRMWSRTKGAVSQNVKKLEEKGLIYRERDTKNAKLIHLYVSETGEQLVMAHKRKDIMDILDMQEDLLATCTKEEIDTFYKVLQSYTDIVLKYRGC